MADNDLAGWVRRARKGDRAAFERVVQLTARAVYAQIAAMVRDRQKAEDLTQETFIAAWKGMGSLENADEGGGVMGWLLTVARNKVRDGVKREGRIKRGGARNPPTELGEGGAADLSGEGTGDGGHAHAGGRPTRASAPLEEVADAGAGPDRVAEAREARERALGLLAELPEEYRQALSMRYLGGADYETIRGALGMTDGALRGVLSRGMAVLRERMTKGNAEFRVHNSE